MTTSTFFTAPSGSVLVASPNINLREQVKQSLHGWRWPVDEVLGGADALAKLESGHWQVLLLDRRLPDLDAEEVTQIIKQRFPGTEVVMLDSDSGAQSWTLDASSSSPAQRLWTQDHEPSPHLPAAATVQPALLPPRVLRSRSEVPPLPGMIGSDEAMQRLFQMTRLVAPRHTTVLIIGPTGSGKELVARALHELSPRSSNALVVLNCAAIPETLLESELFGYARGAFTGAVQAYAGRIQAAQGGTLFLDEIGEMPLSIQAKLLRFLDQREVQRLGSAEVVKSDVRVVAATNVDLERHVEQGKFRADLYYRLAAFPLELPCLADRQDDIVPLAEHFLRKMAYGRAQFVLHAAALELLIAHPWPGNVRELQQVIERAAILADGGEVILPEHIYFGRLAHCDSLYCANPNHTLN